MKLALIILVLATPLTFAQSTQTAEPPAPAPTKPLAFEVASIHPQQGPLHSIMDFSSSGPRVRLEGYNLWLLIMEAYNLKYYQVSMKETDEQRNTYYDIAAAAAEGATPTRDDFRHMLQTLLADRFQLKAHFEKKQMPVYALVAAKAGSKLTPSSEEGRGHIGVNGRNQFFESKSATMSGLAEEIHSDFGTDRPVVDRTGLDGAYKLRVEATPEWRINRDPQPGDLSIFTALQEQLGLKLEPSTASLDVLVIDSTQKPSEN